MRHESDWWLGGFLAAFLIGLSLTLLYTWYLVPAPPNAPPPGPANLTPNDTETYIVLVAAAYRYDGDLPKAKRRLARLEEDDINNKITNLAQRYIAAGADIRDIRSLASLANGLGAGEGFLAAYLITPTPIPTAIATFTPIPSLTATPLASPTPTASVTPTFVPSATSTPAKNPTITPRATFTPGPNAPFGLAQSVALCDNSANGILRVYVRDWQGEGFPGAIIAVSWPGGENKIHTGFKPEISPGYADFEMELNEVYQVELLSPSNVVVQEININAQTACSNLPLNINPSWQVVFQQGAG